jgi:5'-nucleotidase
MQHARRRGAALTVALALATGFAVASPATAGAAEPATVPVQVLTINDFHGRLVADGAQAGAAVVSGAVQQLRAAQPNTVFASAGDSLGASTFDSFIQQDKPTIDALNAAGLEVTVVGNHEFDAGFDDLVNRIMAPFDPATNPRGGAQFAHIGANVRTPEGGPALPETWTKDFGDVQVGFVGVVTEALNTLVSPAGIADIRIESMVTAANRGAASLKAQGADVVVLLVHEGAADTSLATATSNADPLGRLVNAASPDIDAIMSGHTHLVYNHAVPVPAWVDEGRAVTTRPVISGGQYGQALQRLQLQVDPVAGRVTSVSADVVPLRTNTTTPPATANWISNYPADPAVVPIVADAVATANVLGARQLGELTGPFRRAQALNTEPAPAPPMTENRGGESTIGNLVAEVQRAETGTQIAFMNPGGLRADMVGNNAGGYPAALTYRQAATVQPFANTLVAMTLTGAQLKTLLEQQWQPASSRPVLRLGASEGFTWTYDPAAAQGSRITSMQLHGAPVTPTATYSVTVNSFLASGGDGFSVLREGTERRDTGKVDLQAMVDHLAARGSLGPDWSQRSVGVSFPAGAPTAYAPGQEVAFALSSLAMTGSGDAQDSTVTVRLGEAVLGAFPVDNTVGTTQHDEYGRAGVSVTLPAGLPSGVTSLVVTGDTTGTTVTVPVLVEAPVPAETARVLDPQVGATVKGNPSERVSLQVLVGDAPVDDARGAALAAACEVRVSISGARTLAPTCASYDAQSDQFVVSWPPPRGRKGSGPATITVVAADQTIEVPVSVR